MKEVWLRLTLFVFFNFQRKNCFFQAAVLLNQSVQDFTQIYGQKLLFGTFVRKTGSETKRLNF